MIRGALERALLAAYAVLWLGGVASHLGLAASRAPSWGAPAFLTCGAALVCLKSPGARAWLLIAGSVGWLAELAGSKTGLPFGPYSYTDVLQPQVAGVPLVMVCAWLVLIGYVKSLEPALKLTAPLRVLVGAAWMTAIDLAIEPVATGMLGYWRWHAPGIYFGVPASNFAGWFALSAFLLGLGIRAPAPGPAVRRIGLSVVLFFGALGAAAGAAVTPLITVVLVVGHIAISRVPAARASNIFAGR